MQLNDLASDANQFDKELDYSSSVLHYLSSEVNDASSETDDRDSQMRHRPRPTRFHSSLESPTTSDG